jgi:streptogramin lyase
MIAGSAPVAGRRSLVSACKTRRRNLSLPGGLCGSQRHGARNAWHGAIILFSLLLVLLLPPPHVQAAEETGRWHRFTVENGLAGNTVQALWDDGQGSLWVGTENGLSRYDGRTWQTFRVNEGLPDNNVWSIAGAQGAIWCATSNGVGLLQDGRWTRFSTRDGLPGNDVRAILVAADGTVWVGTFGRGIGLLRPGATRWERYEMPPALGDSGTFVQSIWQRQGGEVWFSTNGFGALRLRGGAMDRFSFRVGSRNTVWDVGAAADEATWLATFRGIVRINGDDSVDAIDELVQNVPISQTEVLAVAGGPRNEVWFGTRAYGVLHLHDGRWTRYSADDGPGSNYVQSLLVDGTGRVWFGTRGGGLALLNRQPLPLAQLRPTLSVLDVQSGQPLTLDRPLEAGQNNLQFDFGLEAPWLPPQDVAMRYSLERAGGPPPVQRLSTSGASLPLRAESDAYIDLLPGSYTLRVAAVVDGQMGPEVAVPFTIRSGPPALNADAQTVTADAQTVSEGWVLPTALFQNTRQVRLDFRANDDATASESLRYRYRLVGSEPWQQADGATATLNLPQGTHQLEVQALDADGNMSLPVTLPIVVPPPLWTTILFYLALVILPAVLGTVGGALGYRRWAERQALRRAVSGYLIPYDVGPLITVPDRYIGRGHVLDTVLGKIGNNSFYIWGEKRIGKTSLLLQLKQRLLQRNEVQDSQRFFPVFRNMQDLPQNQFWLYLIRSMAAELPPCPQPLLAHNPPESGYDDLDAESDLETLLRQARVQLGSQAPCIVLLLDEVDTLQRYDASVRQRFRAFCQHTQRDLRVILAGVRPPRGEAGETSPWYNIFEPLTLGPLAESATLSLIRFYNHNPYRYTPEAEQLILALGDGKPYDTQWLCSEAVKAMLNAGRTLVLPTDVAHARGVLLNQRDTDYGALWRSLDEATRQAVGAAAAGDHHLAAEPGAALAEAGLALPSAGGYRLTSLFGAWARAMMKYDV